MKSFHNNPSIKEKYLARVRKHREADNLIQGEGWTEGKGGAVGCTLEKYEPAAYETELGIPRWLAYLEDDLFGGMKKDDAMQWPEKFLEAIPVGVDLEHVKKPLMLYRMNDVKKQFDHAKFPDVLKAIEDVEKAWQTGDGFDEAAAYAARVADHVAYVADAADSGVAYAAYSAAYSAHVAYARAFAAADAARTAAYAATDAYDRAAAYATTNAYTSVRANYGAAAAAGAHLKHSKKLLQLLASAK